MLAESFRHNVREVSRIAGATPLLAVIKNNAYGLGDQVVGPIVAACPEVAGLACTRVSEALALRGAGVRKPILNMAETSEEEIAELVRHEVWPSVWLDDARERLARVAKKLRKRVAVHAFIDTGMNREGMPDYRAQDWLEGLCHDKAILVAGTYMMFNHDLEADREQYARFQRFTTQARQAGLVHRPPSRLAVLRGAPPARGALRPGPAGQPDLWQLREPLRGDEPARPQARLPPVRPRRAPRATAAGRERELRPRRVRGEGADLGRHAAHRPHRRLSGRRANTCSVLIRGRLFPVVSTVASAHTLVEIGADKTIEVGDVATLIGPDDPAITPLAVAEKTGVGFYPLITKLSPFLPKRVV